MTLKKVEKPWGYYTDIFRSKEAVLKTIIVFAGQELSYQSHEGRDEFWFIEKGTGSLTIDGFVAKVLKDANFAIYRGSKHMIKNIGKEDLEIFEIQRGECDENDIIRYSDKYGRD